MDAEHVLREAMERLLTQLEALGDESYLGLARLLYQRAALPGSYVTMVGETSSGKSTLANVLLGQKLLPTAARPTAGTVTHVRCLAENAITYLAINRDGTQERIDRAVFEKLSREPDESLLRLEVRARPMDANLLGLNLFDTPGYNSLIYGHEEALRAFLPQSDAIIYVVSHRVGVGESDQHLFELLGGVRQADPELPVLVVVNRAPATVTKESRRAREIRSHVDDCLRGPFSFHVIGTADPGPAEGEVLRVPGLEVVWKEVREIVLSEGRRTAVVAKLTARAVSLVDEADALAERRQIVLMAAADEKQATRTICSQLEDAERRSLETVDRCMDRLDRLVPSTLNALSKNVASQLGTLVMSSERWLGKDECIAFVEAHALPRAVRGAARALEDSIALELELLEAELEDIANTAINAIETSPVIRSEALQRFAKNIAVELARRVAGKAAIGALRALGGSGGAAAGAGNLVKMLVARGGRLFGHVFGRKVYDAIGSFFTKRMLARLTVALQVVIDAATFVWDAATWQEKLREQVEKAVDEWREAVEKDVKEKDLPSLRAANVASVHEVYALRKEQQDGEQEAQTDVDRATRLDQLTAVRSELSDIRCLLAGLEGGAA